jgi:transketolase
MNPYENCLLERVQNGSKLVVMTAENRAAIRNLPEHLGNRFIDVGIAEQSMIGMAAGMALSGHVPVVHALATFLVLRAFEFIRTDVGIPGLPVKLVGGVPGILSEANGPTHQAIEDVALMRGIPNMEVFCPTDVDELGRAMPQILDSGKPAYIRYPSLKPMMTSRRPFVHGQADTLTEGNDVTILSYGYMVREALEAREHLTKEGLGVRVVDMRTLAPIDEKIIVRSALESKMVVTLEDHFLSGGLFTAVAEVWALRGITRKILPIGFDRAWFTPALLDDSLRKERMKGQDVAKRILAALAGQNTQK